MLMSILCPLNLSVHFLWCVQFLSIKHRGVKQAAGRLVPLLQAWISPFCFSYLSWMGKGEGPGGRGSCLERVCEKEQRGDTREFWGSLCLLHGSQPSLKHTRAAAGNMWTRRWHAFSSKRCIHVRLKPRAGWGRGHVKMLNYPVLWRFYQSEWMLYTYPTVL